MTEPERLDHFMARANTAYYARKNPFRDFTTAPEITQIFGEVLGAWAATVWDQLGCPDPVLLVEAGPGRGTLMQDALRGVARAAPRFKAASRVHFIETSERLRAEQAARVPEARWHDDLASLPDGPIILIANEFLDALPIRQFVRRGDSSWERYVLDGAFVELPAGPIAHDCPDGGMVEQADAAAAWIVRLATRIAALGGAALILDYGTRETRPGDSLQALRDGKPADPLAAPGEADLTSHVDFASLRRNARNAGAEVFGPLSQGIFLARIGLGLRAERLAAANPARAGMLREAASRLLSPTRMGDLFKAMCILAKTAPAPPGFDR